MTEYILTFLLLVVCMCIVELLAPLLEPYHFVLSACCKQTANACLFLFVMNVVTRLFKITNVNVFRFFCVSCNPQNY